MSPTTSAPYELTDRAGLPVLDWKLFAGQQLDAVMTTRDGGVSAGPYAGLNLGLHVGDDEALVVENRRRAARAVGLELDDLVFCNQKHQREVALVGEADRGRGARTLDGAIDGVDALVTTTPGVGLVVMVADCVPIVLYDPGAHVLACVHAGWGGTVRWVAEAAVTTMASLGADPGRVLAALGPAIEPDRYQVGDDVAGAARDAFGSFADHVVRPDGHGRWLFDLWSANRHVLLEVGLDPANVAMSAEGTAHEQFFSDRARRPCGRFAAIAALRSRAAT